MSAFFKYSGILLILLFSSVVSREYDKYLKKRLAEASAFLSYINHIRKQISRFLSPVSDWRKSYSDSTLENIGFLPRVRDGEGLDGAFQACAEGLSLSAEMKNTLGSFFSDFGRGYLEEEIKKADAAFLQAEEIFKKESEECKKSSKIAKTLLLSLALSLALILL